MIAVGYFSYQSRETHST